MRPRYHHDDHRDRGNRRPVGLPDHVRHDPCRVRHDRPGYPAQRPCAAFGLVKEPLPYPLGTDGGRLGAVRPFPDPVLDPGLGAVRLDRHGLAGLRGHPAHRVRPGVERAVRHRYSKKMGC